jgi:hypothetical protein
MKAIRKIVVAAVLSAGLVTAAQAHMFVGVGVVGGPVFPVDSAAQSAPLLPVYAAPVDSGPAPLPPDAPPPKFVAPDVSSFPALIGHPAPATESGGI